MKKTIKIKKEELQMLAQDIYDKEQLYICNQNKRRLHFDIIERFYNGRIEKTRGDVIQLTYEKARGIIIVISELAQQHYINELYEEQKTMTLDELVEEIWNKERNRGQ